MARFVKFGKYGSMINVEQITAIYPNDKSDKYTVCMTDGTENYVTHDEFLEITGQRQCEASDKQCEASDKKYAIKVFPGDHPLDFLDKYLVLNRETGTPVISTNDDYIGWQSHFTKKEIEELKKRDDITIDWDKVELEEVDE